MDENLKRKRKIAASTQIGTTCLQQTSHNITCTYLKKCQPNQNFTTVLIIIVVKFNNNIAI